MHVVHGTIEDAAYSMRLMRQGWRMIRSSSCGVTTAGISGITAGISGITACGANIRTTNRPLYDYEKDPLETKNLIQVLSEVATHLKSLLAKQPEAKPQIQAEGDTPKKKAKKKPLRGYNFKGVVLLRDCLIDWRVGLATWDMGRAVQLPSDLCFTSTLPSGWPGARPPVAAAPCVKNETDS
jgi:hypothetical protein